MLRVAFQGLRGRKGPFVGAFLALAVAAALVMACGTLLQAGVQSKSPVERYSAAPIVVAGDQNETVNAGTDAEDSIPLFERARVSSSLVPRLAAVAGVRHAIGDVDSSRRTARLARRGRRPDRAPERGAPVGDRRTHAVHVAQRTRSKSS